MRNNFYLDIIKKLKDNNFLKNDKIFFFYFFDINL